MIVAGSPDAVVNPASISQTINDEIVAMRSTKGQVSPIRFLPPSLVCPTTFPARLRPAHTTGVILGE